MDDFFFSFLSLSLSLTGLTCLLTTANLFTNAGAENIEAVPLQQESKAEVDEAFFLKQKRKRKRKQ